MSFTFRPGKRVVIQQRPSLWGEEAGAECSAYLSKQLITYIGNKRSLLGFIGKAIGTVQARLGKTRLNIFDAFSGSGVVSRFFKQYADLLICNDLEAFAAVAARCHLRNRSEVQFSRLSQTVDWLNAEVSRTDLGPGFIEELYAPKDEDNIKSEDRVFYTRDNAARLDNYRRLLNGIADGDRDLLMGPLLSEASIHANTSGVFKGFYKDRDTGAGKFGGSNGDALTRIRGQISLDVPVLSRFESDVEVYQQDANYLARRLRRLDLAYLDPPYNQHPYGSNYFMLNLLVGYQRPKTISEVSGIPTDWERSDYNVRSRCFRRLADLVQTLDAPFILVSFNDEGFIPPAEMTELLGRVGKVEIIEIPYNTFRGSRNLRNRKIHVTEHLYLVERR